MAIFQMGKTWYVDYYTGKGKDKKRIREAVGHKKADAIARLGKIQAAKRENRFFDMKKEYNTNFDELLERYEETFKGQKTFKCKRCYFPVLRDSFSGRLLSEVTPYDLEMFRNKRKATPLKAVLRKFQKAVKLEMPPQNFKGKEVLLMLTEY